MATPLKKTAPIWLARQDENDPLLSPSYRRSVKYYRKLYAAWPEWCADHPDFAKVYREAIRRCEQCDLTWDINDSDPPECRTPHDIAMDAIKRDLDTVCIKESKS